MVDLTAQVQRLQDAQSKLNDTETALTALEIQKTELVGSIAEIKLQHEEFTKQAKLSEVTKSVREQALDQSIDAKTKTLAALDSKVSQLEVKEADLINKLDDLAGKDVLLSNATEALKAVESHKAELLAAITQMTAERDTLTRDVLTGAEKGRAQHTLTQTLIARREAAEKELQAGEEQRATLSSELGKVRESLRAAESAFETKQKELNEVEAGAESLRKQVEETTKQQAKLQQELSEWSSKLIAAKTDFEATSADTQAKVKAAEEAAASHAQHSAQLTSLQAKMGGLEVLLATLGAAHLEKETQFNALESQQRAASDLLTTRQQEITAEEARLAELRSLTTTFDSRVAELSATEKKLNETKGTLIKATQDMDKAQSETKRLQDERADHEKRLPTLRAESETVQANLAAKLKELALSDARFTGLNQQVKDLDVRLKELKSAEVAMEKTQLEVTRLTAERDTINTFVATLLTQREDHEKILPGLRADVDVLRTELRTLTQDKQSTVNALEKVQAERNAVSDQATVLRTEVTQLEKLLNDKRGTLEAETKTKLAEANQAEATLREVSAKVAAAEKRAIELVEIEKRLSSATITLKDTENQRLAEEKALATLASQQEKMRKDLAMLEESAKSTQVQIAELTKKAKTEEARHAESVMLAEKSNAALQAVETKRAEAEAALTKAREEEKNLRKNIPALNTEMAGLQAALTTLTRDREEASQYVSRLNVTTEGSNRKLSELQQQISQLEEAHRLREERVIKAQADVDNEGARLKVAQEQTRSAEVALLDLDRQVKEGRQKAEATRTQVTNQEAELSSRLDRVQSLKTDEERLNKELVTRQQEIQEAEANVAELRDKISSEQKRVVEFTHIGGQVLTLGAALASLETRQGETARSLRDAAERELALQVKINALQESYNRESARVEEVKKNRVGIEAEMATFADKSQKQMASLKAVESEQQKRLTDVEKHLHEQATLFERVKSELAGLQDRRAEFAQAEAQLRHWQEIEARLRGQLLELEEKHEIMRRGLPTDEATVVMFANDLIKRIDLIDALTARYSGHSGGDVVTQLGTLRASFEDILLQHGVTEFDIAAGTEVDTQLRKRIAVVDSLPGKEKPRVVETCRSGFMYSREEGHEVILRKVEVRTSSQ
ncbi:MAG: nucleotide exchange factor GrpE, partial [Prosthecobacter sp.]